MKIKVMSYNIKNGFFDKDKNNKLRLNKTREKSAQKIIKKENPEILIIVEADFAERKSNPQNYKRIFKYPYGVFVDRPLMDRYFGIGILSKYPIIQSYKYAPKKSRWIEASIKTKDKTIYVNATHPSPLNTLVEKVNLFKKVLNNKKHPYILAGDFNSISPEDKYDKNKLLEGFIKKFNNRKKAEVVVNKIFKKETIKLLLKEGLVDTYKKKNKKWDYTYHTKLSGNNYMRIDYIFCSNDIKVVDSGIIKNILTEKASDHYPIYAILEI